MAHNRTLVPFVTIGGGVARGSQPRSVRSGGGKRGKVSGFSAASRRRLLFQLSCVKYGAAVYFVTLTYPADFPDTEKSKAHLRAFFERLRRAKPHLSAVWRLEYQRRGAPHYHLLVFGVRQGDGLREYVKEKWYRVVASGDEKHFAAGTQCDRVRSHRGVMAYAAKYISKVGEAPQSGRVWGWHNKAALEFDCLKVEMSPYQYAQVRRVLRRLTRSRYLSNVSYTVYSRRVQAVYERIDELLALFSDSGLDARNKIGYTG